MWLVFSVGVASAGYADAFDGLPSHEERETFLWTNAVRIDPSAFEADYPCSFSSFSSSEQQPKSLLWFDEGLAEAANYHSTDMDEDGYFDHDSNDGTSWDDRIYSYYDGSTIGENIAWGYRSPFSAVIEGWMCSSGHRSNIMSAGYDELGTGVSGDYWTQDFGNGDAPDRVMAMGLHLPEDPGGEVSLAVDLEVPTPVDAIYAVLDGDRVDLQLELGTDTLGLWTASASVSSGDCHVYYFVAESGPLVETWPEDGSYGFGPCAFDDAGARWVASQEPLPGAGTTTTDPGGTDPGTTDPGTGGGDPTGGDPPATSTAGGTTAGTAAPPAGCGCAGGPPGAGGLALLALVCVRGRRRTA